MKSQRIFPVIVLITVISLLLTLQVGKYARDWSLSQLKEQGEDRLLDIISQVRSELAEYKYLPFLISQNRDVASLLLDPRPDKIAAVSLYLEQTNLVAGTTALFVLDAAGQAKAFSHWRDQQDFYQESHANAPYFEQARQGQQGLFVALPDQDSVGSFYLSAPVYNRNRLSGVATVRIDLDLLQPSLAQSGQYIFSKDNTVLLASEPRWTLQPLSQVVVTSAQQELNDGSVISLNQLDDGRTVMMQKVSLDDLGWQVSVINDLAEVNRIGRNARISTLAACIALSLLLLFLRERQLKNLSRQETRLALERNEAQQRNIINTAHVGMITLDSNGDILFINPMAMQQFGVSMPRVLGINISALIAAEVYDGILKKVMGRLGSKGFAPITALETVGARSDKTEFPMLFSIKQMSRMPEPVYLVTVIDITPRKRLEKALQQANDQLEHKVQQRTLALKEAQDELVQAEKMAALGRMSTAVVHELNQPLTALRTYISICRQLIVRQDTEQLDSNLQLINDLTDRMAVITQQLKTFAYKKPAHLTPVDPLQSLEQVVALFRGRLQENHIQLQFNRPMQGLAVSADSARLEQIFVNLISNACDALAGGEKPQLCIAAEFSEEQLKITLKDNGAGITKEDQQHLFEPFFTTKNIGEGLGLGLSIVRSILRDLNGDISVVSCPGETCFTVTLPLYAESGENT